MGITIEEIESAVKNFSPEELSEFSKWFEEFEEKIWDNKIARDVESGKLKDLIDEAEKDHLNGNVREL